jgi:hypothetical protein
MNIRNRFGVVPLSPSSGFMRHARGVKIARPLPAHRSRTKPDEGVDRTPHLHKALLIVLSFLTHSIFKVLSYSISSHYSFHCIRNPHINGRHQTRTPPDTRIPTATLHSPARSTNSLNKQNSHKPAFLKKIFGLDIHLRSIIWKSTAPIQGHLSTDYRTLAHASPYYIPCK